MQPEVNLVHTQTTYICELSNNLKENKVNFSNATLKLLVARFLLLCLYD